VHAVTVDVHKRKSVHKLYDTSSSWLVNNKLCFSDSPSYPAGQNFKQWFIIIIIFFYIFHMLTLMYVFLIIQTERAFVRSMLAPR
jgi:hypothetical protein